MNFIEMEQTISCQQLEIEDLRAKVAAQAAVIEKLREALLVSHDLSTSTITRLLNTIPTDSTQILNEVRRAERERVYQVADNAYATEHVLLAIRAME